MKIMNLSNSKKENKIAYIQNSPIQNSPMQNSPIQNSPEKFENERKNEPIQKVRKTVPIINCFNKPAGRELSFVQQT